MASRSQYCVLPKGIFEREGLLRIINFFVHVCTEEAFEVVDLVVGRVGNQVPIGVLPETLV